MFLSGRRIDTINGAVPVRIEEFTMNVSDKPAEAELITGCISNDRKYQQKVYELFYGKMMGVCLRYAANRDEAKDILQDGFIKVFDKIKTFNREGSLEGWIRRIMTNTAIDNFRKNRNNYAIIDYNQQIETLENREDENEEQEDSILNKIKPEEILKLVQMLTPAYRTVFSLFVVDGYSHKQIAQELGISEGASKSNLSKAKARIKILLNELSGINR
jgi:RNA polymerase sigma factor (sigma-70 family)